MGKYLKGKQIDDNSITSDLFNLTTPNSGDTLSGATKEYADNYAIGSSYSHNPSNLDMLVNTTYNDGDLACNTSILSIPKSFIRVVVNGLEVSVGIGKECYFSNDGGITPQDNGSELIGDYLYWNGSISGYQLSVADDDELDFIYLIDK
jgi:hypothetical protein